MKKYYYLAIFSLFYLLLVGPFCSVSQQFNNNNGFRTATISYTAVFSIFHPRNQSGAFQDAIQPNSVTSPSFVDVSTFGSGFAFVIINLAILRRPVFTTELRFLQNTVNDQSYEFDVTLQLRPPSRQLAPSETKAEPIIIGTSAVFTVGKGSYQLNPTLTIRWPLSWRQIMSQFVNERGEITIDVMAVISNPDLIMDNKGEDRRGEENNYGGAGGDFWSSPYNSPVSQNSEPDNRYYLPL